MALLQMMTGISELIVWLTLIAAIAIPSIAWGVSITKLNQMSVRLDKQDGAIEEQEKMILTMKEKLNETNVQFATITTLLQQNIVPNITDLKASLRDHSARADKLIDVLITITSNDKKDHS